jgi:hypothetical protein
VLEPVTRYANFFADINELVKKRGRKLLDYDSFRSKTRKLVERPANDPGKLSKAEADAAHARQVYETLSSRVLEDMVRVRQMRDVFLEASLDAFFKLQFKLARDMADELGSIRMGTCDDFDARVETSLQQLRGLAIVQA